MDASFKCSSHGHPRHSIRSQCYPRFPLQSPRTSAISRYNLPRRNTSHFLVHRIHGPMATRAVPHDRTGRLTSSHDTSQSCRRHALAPLRLPRIQESHMVSSTSSLDASALRVRVDPSCLVRPQQISLPQRGEEQGESIHGRSMGCGSASKFLGIHDLEDCVCDSGWWVGFWWKHVAWLHLFVLFHFDTYSGGIYEGQIWETVGSCHSEGAMEVLARDLVKGWRPDRFCSANIRELTVDCHIMACLSEVCLSYSASSSYPSASR